MAKTRPEESREQEMKVVVGKVLSRVDPPSFVVGLVVGCFLVSLTYTLTPKSHGMLEFSIPSVETRPSLSHSVAADSVAPMRGNITSNLYTVGSEGIIEREIVGHLCDPRSSQCAGRDDGSMLKKTSAIAVPMQRPAASDTKQTDVEPQIRRPLCDTSRRWSDVCDIEGDVRVLGKEASSVILVTPPPPAGSANLEPWVIKPYARKMDPAGMANVRKVNVKPSYSYGHESPQCSVNHTVPAIVFSIAGYTGNYFHDFADVLVPLFQTASRFDGEVQFLVANYKAWWIMKYGPFFKKLTRYEVIDYDNDDRVHCFRHVVVGMRSDGDLVIDPAGSPMGHSMVDFAKFMRSAYGLPRERAARTGGKPRLLIIARGGTRKFTNLSQIVRAAERAGFEAVVTEASFGGVAEFARVVNSCDAMMGVHGAGLTNFVFLPVDAVLIQVVPFGGLDWIAGNDFGEPSKRAGLRYLEYAIGVEESTLTELYPRDDPVFTDVKSIHRRGWKQMGAIYLDKQNVKLDVKRFRPVLKKAMRLLTQNA